MVSRGTWRDALRRGVRQVFGQTLGWHTPTGAARLPGLHLDSLRKGDLAIFCGAGISANSGLPLARQLQRYVLGILTQDTRDIEIIMRSHLPFEAFMESLFRNYSPTTPFCSDEVTREYQEENAGELAIRQAALALLQLALSASGGINTPHTALLHMFVDENLRPNSTHLLLARLAQHRYVRTIVTTNFDCLIEAACELHSKGV